MTRRLFLLAAAIAAQLTTPLHAQTVDLNTGFAAGSNDAKGRVNVTLARGITHSRQLPRDLVQAKKTLSRTGRASISDLRRMADLADGNAAYQLAKRLDLDRNPGLAADAAHYFGIAAATGRGGAIYGMVKALDRLDPADTTEGRLKTLRTILIAYARAGSTPATEAMLRYHVAGKPFDNLRADLDKLVVQSDGPAADSVALQLASEILHSADPDQAALADARRYLAQAEDAESLRLQLIAGNLRPLVDARLAALDATKTQSTGEISQ